MNAEYWASIKGFDTEEKLDLLIYRPAGFAIAKVAHRFKMNPTQLSLLGVLSGVLAGFLFTFPESTEILLGASFLFVLSGIFDSSDGQLARISGQSSPLGLILDGICDSVVFMSVYAGCAWAVWESGLWGWEIFPLAAFGLILHSAQSSILDFYNREYLFFGYGKTQSDTYWNPDLSEARETIRDAKTFKEKLFHRLRYSWLSQQTILSTRKAEDRRWLRILVKEGSPRAARAQEIYRDSNRLMLRFWRLMGPNFHTMMMIVFALFRRFDLYLILIDFIFLNVALLVLRSVQRKIDQRMLDQIRRLPT